MAPFLTELDPRAAVKGSRDPLGIQAIWSRFGRHVVGNLSNASNSVRDFTVLILGYHFAATVADLKGPGTELATFLKWEQLANYSRAHINGDWAFRGTERVRKNLENTEVTISADTKHQILSNQKAYGIWGLYSVPGRASGLLDGHPARLTLAAQELVETTYLASFTESGLKEGKALVELLSEEEFHLDVERTSDARILKAVARVLRPTFGSEELQFYQETLYFGGPSDSTSQRQRQLAELLRPKITQNPITWSPSAVLGLAKEAEAAGEQYYSLAHYLRRIEAVERVLAPVSELFSYLLGCDGVASSEVVQRMRKADSWGKNVPTVSLAKVEELKTELANGDDQAGQRWLQIATSMTEGEYPRLITLLVQQNKSVMQARGGAAWIEEEQGKLKVRVSEERGHLPSRDSLPNLWRFPYFLDSLCSVGMALHRTDRRAA